jgi:hypothetical protein
MPLAFTDEALARVFIAATAVPPEKQSAWLRRIAKWFEANGDQKRTHSRYAVNQRRYRIRFARKHSVLRVPAHRRRVAALLIRERYLPDVLDRDAIDRSDLEAALAAFIDDLTK